MRDRIRIALRTPDDHWASDAARLALRYGADERGFEVTPDQSVATLIINFLRRQKVPPSLQSRTINIHPAPSEYPGVGAPARAILDGATWWGATAHRTIEKYDAGPVLANLVRPLPPGATPRRLLFDGELMALEMIPHLLDLIVKCGPHLDAWPATAWRGSYWSRRDFEAAMTRDVTTPELARFARAFVWPGKPGPYLQVEGSVFELRKSDA